MAKKQKSRCKQKEVKVRVKQKHIDDGRPESEYCPIALAMQAALPELDGISVDGSDILIDDENGDNTLVVKLPKKLAQFVVKFDEAKGEYEELQVDLRVAFNDSKEETRIKKLMAKVKFPKPFSFTFLVPKVIKLEGAVRL